MGAASDRTTATADLYRAARKVAELARDAQDLATPGPRIDLARSRAKLGELAQIAAEASRA